MGAALGTVFLDAGMRGFIINTARKEFWRVASWYEFDDLVQDGYLCFAKCYSRYVRTQPHLTGTPDERRWFQALVRTTFYNHITDLAKDRMRLHEEAASHFLSQPGETPEDILEKNLPAQQELGSLSVLLAQAPWELLELIRLLAKDAGGFQWQKVGRRSLRETTNEHYCRLLQIDPQERDIVGELKEHFGLSV